MQTRRSLQKADVTAAAVSTPNRPDPSPATTSRRGRSIPAGPGGFARKSPISIVAALALAAVLVLSGFPGFAPGALEAEEGPRIAAASYPVWLFTRWLNHGRDYFDVELMTNPETGCPHEFTPQPRDLEKLTQTKTLVENGLNLEAYLERALRVAPKDIYIIDASSSVPTLHLAYGRMTIPGEPRDMGGLNPNPHIFLSPRLAGIMAENIANGLAEKDPGGELHYKERLALFKDDMVKLESELETFKKTRNGYKVVASHGFMDYLAKDLGILVLADIEPAPEVAPSPGRLRALSELIRGERISAILTDPHADLKLAKTLGAETGVPVAVIDPVTSGSADPPPDYYQTVIREDLRTLARLFPVNMSGQ
jgi:ABC-type Zn uptake system ZnuABC Zn-binding protein ZnuA